MNSQNLKKEKINFEKQTNIISDEPKLNKEKDYNYFIYEEKNDYLDDEIFVKKRETNNSHDFKKHKNSNLNLAEKNLHEFLNDDLIKALDNDLAEPDENYDILDSNSNNGNITGSSECTSKTNSPELNIRPPKYIKNIDMNLDIENNFNNYNSNLNNIKNNLTVNKDFINNKIKNKENYDKIQTKKEDYIDNNIKDRIKMLNDPLFAPMLIPKKIDNKNEKKIEKHHKIKHTDKKNNPLKNKFDDDIEPIIMLSMVNNAERTKMPLEIREGDWICLYCNNLNFSFRIKCNRCGMLRKSSSHLLNQKRNYDNKYQFMGNYNYFNDEYFMNYNQSIDYDLNNNNINNFHDNKL